MRFFDAHSHIHDKDFDADRSEVLARMRAARVETITVGTHLSSSRKAVELAEKESDVWATVGLHPTDTDESFFENEYLELARSERVAAIGECGLDYFWQKGEEERKLQRENFTKHIELALAVGKPLMIHARPSRGSMDAYEDVLYLVTSYKLQAASLGGNIHFFVGDKNIAKRFLDLGFTMSFTGVITFTSDYDEVIKYLPLDSILAETDCPLVAPVPQRGKRNEPAFVTYVIEHLGKLKGLETESMSDITYGNTQRVFGLNRS